MRRSEAMRKSIGQRPPKPIRDRAKGAAGLVKLVAEKLATCVATSAKFSDIQFQPVAEPRRRFGLARMSMDIPVVAGHLAAEPFVQDYRFRNPFVVVIQPDADLKYSQPFDFEGRVRVSEDLVLTLGVWRGKLPLPTIRIDDYPTGIRPRLADLSGINRILEHFEEAGVSYHLGISPGLLDRQCCTFLSSLRYIIPCLHGFDHNYWRLSGELRRSGDVYNKRVNTFVGHLVYRAKNFMFPMWQSEFRGDHPEVVVEKLILGRERLEDIFQCPIDTYIPPFNRPHPYLGPALDRLGFVAYMSQHPMKHTALTGMRSDCYGDSSQFDPRRRPTNICLHTLWEWDLVRTKGAHQLHLVTDYVRQTRNELLLVEKRLQQVISEDDTPSGSIELA